MKSLLLKILCLTFIIPTIRSQEILNIKNETSMPFHTKILWGENGMIRKLNLAPQSRKQELKLRTKMLQNHQKLALVSLGMLTYQASLGYQLKEGDFTNLKKHRTFSKVSWSMYMTSAGLSYFAPPGMVYEKRISSMKIHKWLSYVHFAGMLAIPILGKNITTAADYDKALKLHQNVASLTLISMSLSGLLTVLPY